MIEGDNRPDEAEGERWPREAFRSEHVVKRVGGRGRMEFWTGL